jgi:hypothetical protein
MSEILAYAALALALLACAAFFWAFGWIRNRLARLFAGGEGESLGDALGGQGERLVRLEQQVRELAGRQEAETQDLAARLERAREALDGRVEELAGYAAGALRHVHLHSYAVGNGGPESAVVVLTNDAGDGVLWTVLAGKTVRYYTRLVRGWRAEQLSQDEEQALQAAREKAGR